MFTPTVSVTASDGFDRLLCLVSDCLVERSGFTLKSSLSLEGSVRVLFYRAAMLQ